MPKPNSDTSLCVGDSLMIGPFAAIAVSGITLAATSLVALAAPHSWLLVALLLSGAVGMLIGLVWAYRRIRHGFVEPLQAIRIWAQHMSNGDLAAQIEIDGSRQCSKLAEEINQLAEQYRLLSWDMESQVSKQTEVLAQRTRDLQLLYELAQAVSVSDDLDSLLTRFLYTLIAVVRAQAGTVRVLTPDGRMRLAASYGLEDTVADLEASETPMEKPGLEDLESMQMIAIPLQYRGTTLGIYNLYGSSASLRRSQDQSDLLKTIGQHLGMTISRTNLERERHSMSIMAERTQLAHELHDSIAQTLASMKYQGRLLEDDFDKDNRDSARRHLINLRGTVDEAYSELRELIAHFRAPLDKRGLIPSLKGLMDSFRKRTEIATFLQLDCDDMNLPADVEMQVLRIIQESLANVRKHSQAQTVRLLIRCDEENYSILLEDDGIGFDDQIDKEQPGEHIGLSIMQQRAHRVGGHFSIETEEGEGTRVMLEFPKGATQQVRMKI